MSTNEILKYCFYTTVFFSTNISKAEILNPIVNTPLGKIQGTTKESIDGQVFYAFEGVPYAKPPIGPNRFEDPQEIEPWSYTWQANTTFKCLQYRPVKTPDLDPIIGEEDCLYLNIFTSKMDPTAKLNVILYIHGGAFMYNFAGKYGPEILLNNNVIFVSINYRLGPLGFLSTEDDIVPGNIGLKDQILALKWVKKYITHFGGNPNSVTIAGNSAGGASVHLHYLMPASQGLFHRGISQSGSALNPWVLMEAPLEKAQKIAATVGCPTVTNEEMVGCLKMRPARQIVEATKKLQPWLYNPLCPFGVVVDSWSKNPLLPDHPYNLLKNKKVYDVPWIISHTNSEGLCPAADFYAENRLKEIDGRWSDLAPHLMDFNHTVDYNYRDFVSLKIKKFYFKNKALSRASFPELVQMFGDRLFVVDIQKSARLHAIATKSPTYFYYFTYRGTHSTSEWDTGTTEDFGAAHTDDLHYIVNLKMDTYSASNDSIISNLLVDMWCSYANTGTPNVGSVEWPEISKKSSDKFIFLSIPAPENPNAEVMGNPTFWESLPIKENEKLFKYKEEL